MSVWSRALLWDAKRNGFLSRALKGLSYPLRSSGGMLGERSYAQDVGDGSANSIVIAVLNWIALNFTEAPIALWTREAGLRKRLDDDAAILTLLEEPNPYYDGVQLQMATTLSWNVDGNGYWRKLRSGAGRVVALLYYPHFNVEPQGPSTDPLRTTFYRCNVGGYYEEVPAADIVHFRHGIDPDNPRKGRSKLYGLLREVYSDEEAARFTAAILRNMGIPGVVISPEPNTPEPGEEDAKALREDIKNRYRGDHRGEPLFIGASVKVTSFGFSPKDLDLSALRDVAEERISAALGVPASVVGFGAGLQTAKVGATYAEMRDQAWQNNIIPTQRVFAATLKQQLLGDFYGETQRRRMFIGFDTSQVAIMADYNTKVAEKHGQLVRESIETRAEARRALDLPAGPRDEVYLVNAGVTEVDATKAVEPPKPAAPLALTDGASANGHGPLPDASMMVEE